jgi:hypothetical protein
MNACAERNGDIFGLPLGGARPGRGFECANFGIVNIHIGAKILSTAVVVAHTQTVGAFLDGTDTVSYFSCSAID